MGTDDKQVLVVGYDVGVHGTLRAHHKYGGQEKGLYGETPGARAIGLSQIQHGVSRHYHLLNFWV